MTNYLKVFIDSFTGYWNYLVYEIAHPHWHNYFYMLILFSLLVWVLEIALPWRKNQAIFRKGFWMDAFYMFFNFFLFSLVGYNDLSNIGVELFNNFLSIFNISNVVAINISNTSIWIQFLIMLIVADFIQWAVHYMLHHVPWLWKFHKVHHSVTEMGFAAHLRFHWMETIIYKSALYIPLTMIGFGISDFFVLHAFTTLIGHLNHANINLSYGPFKYLLNNPVMHIWHHAKTMPEDRPFGMNYGITLSIWDYIFRTAYVPSSGRDIALGFDDIETYPEDFKGQMIKPFKE